MKQGTVVWFKDDKGYGFLKVDGEAKELFVHFTAIRSEDRRRTLVKGQRVQFEVVAQGDGRHAAANVTVIA